MFVFHRHTHSTYGLAAKVRWRSWSPLLVRVVRISSSTIHGEPNQTQVACVPVTFRPTSR